MAKSKGNRKGRRITTKAVQETENLPPPQIPVVEIRPEPDDDPWELDGLSIRQRRFCEAYVTTAAGNGRNAAEAAGYRAENRCSLAVTATRLLKYPAVRGYIGRLLTANGASVDFLKSRLAQLASSSLENVATLDDGGEVVIDMKQAAAMGALGQLKEWKEDVLKGPDGKTAVVRRTVKVHDPTKAIELLLKMHGSLVDRHELTGKNGGPIETKQMPDEDKLRSIWQRCVGNDRSVESDPSPDRN